MPRPRCQVNLRIDLELKNLFTEKCKRLGISKSYYLKQCIRILINKDCDKFTLFEKSLIEKNLIREIKAYGNNLNQLTHKLNYMFKNPKINVSRKEGDEAMKKMDHIRDGLNEFLDNVRKAI